MYFFRNTFMTAYKNKSYPNRWDILAFFFVLGVISVLAWNAKQMSVPYHLGQSLPISLDPHYLPGYALRTVSRMFIALMVSLLFTLIFGTWAAKNKRAERLIIPVIDILQSIPVLGMLSITIVGFIALFPHSMLGPECAAIFAIFTSQAWNMALGFYQTVRTVPNDLHEAAEMFHLSAWQKFWRIDVPFSMPGLLWNTMLSMSAGWFFVVASEAISVSNQQILLPGIGSYITYAIAAADMRAIGYAILTMFIIILLYDQFLFRPLIAWAEKFKYENVRNEKEATSWVISLLHRTRTFKKIGEYYAKLFDAFLNAKIFRKKVNYEIPKNSRYERVLDRSWNIFLIITLISSVAFLFRFVIENVPINLVPHVFMLGTFTAIRVLVCIVLISLIWVPVGVWIGLRPNAALVVQPIAQFLAAFPANLLYPLFVIVIVKEHLNPEIWLTPLMVLGAQWYVLFNVIAGASQIPKDLIQVVDVFNVTRWQRWKKLILPGIFPYYITGAITAVGGAWNASIVTEVVSWGNEKLVASGVGAYITQYTTAGNFPRIALGIGVMSIFVLTLNRIVWRPLYVLATSRFRLD